jgi:hypothetical protein
MDGRDKPAAASRRSVHADAGVDRFGQPHARPEVKIEADSRIAALRAFRELGLQPEEVEESRPLRPGLRAVS